eukprot:gb/GECH01000976.1/.p1 GENE.gb/GECH01000976.1/~~gb/GECH01000976.1/.p1  ORF type:complete len:471 (+),score=105.61 gb/GECH01000976.1/:1-1413(+)
MSVSRLPIKCGDLLKKRPKFPQIWQKRHFRLYKGYLRYYKYDKNDELIEKGVIKLLPDTRIQLLFSTGTSSSSSSGSKRNSNNDKNTKNQNTHSFLVVTSDREFRLGAPSHSEAQSWSSSIMKAKREPQIGRVVFLGSGEVGKTTIYKQLRIICAESSGFQIRAPEERTELFKNPVWSSMILNMKILVSQAEALSFPLEGKDHEAQATFLKDLDVREVVTKVSEISGAKVWNVLSDLWQDSGIQKAFQNRDKFHINDNAAYFFDNISRIGRVSYVPSVEDMVRDYLKTGKPQKDWIVFNSQVYKIIDTGGTRPERKKWVNVIKSTNSYVFVCALSDFNEVMLEDNETNRMMESLDLFEEICNSYFVDNCQIFLVFNKSDLFREKLEHFKIIDYFNDFPSHQENTFENGIKFFKNKFIQIAKQALGENADIPCYVLSAVEPSHIQSAFSEIFNSVKDYNSLKHKARKKSLH